MMKTLCLFLLLGITAVYCVWYHSTHGASIIPDERNRGVKWNDSLYKHLPPTLDTSILVMDSKGTPLKFRQYIKPVFNHEAVIFRDKDVWRLQRSTETGLDSLERDDYAVARYDRWQVVRQPDTVKAWRNKLNNIAKILAQADYVLVLKSQRQLLVKRKGITIASLPISMGREPVGKKHYENDGKTPEGIYHLDLKWVRNDKYYKSFVISYPNDEDKAFAKLKGLHPGTGVMIHGTKPGKLPKDWTAGCIALSNNNMDTLFKYVASGTVIEIRK